MEKRKRYHLRKLLTHCKPSAPMPDAMREWDQLRSVGLEQPTLAGQANIQEAALAFSEKLADRFGVVQLILYGSRARGNYKSESDADLAVILSGSPVDFVVTKLDMASVAFDVLVETGVLIQPLPIWESEWNNPKNYSNPALLQNIVREGIVLWSV